MNRIIYYIILFSTTTLFASCLKEEENIFSKSASERTDAVIEEGRTALLSSKKGWIMEYFPDNESDGFTLLMKFESPDKIMAACRNYITGDIYHERSSCFDLVADDGPVLTFNTYNEVIHLFSDPYIPGFPIGVGLGGDYEFRIRKVSEDSLMLKGKKRSTPIIMTRFPDDVTWQEYFEELSKLDEFMFSVAGPPLVLRTEQRTYYVTGGYDHIFELKPTDADENTVAVTAPFIVTRTGIRFSNALELDGHTLQTFNINGDKTALISMEDPTIMIEGPELNTFIKTSTVSWNFARNTVSPSLYELYDRLDSSLKSKYGASKVELSFRSRDEYLSLNITLTVGRNKLIGNINLDMALEGEDKITLKYNGNADVNGANFYNNAAGLKEFTDLLSDQFRLSTENSFNPSTLKMEKISDPNTWISISY